MARPKNKDEYRAELAETFAHVLEERGLEWRKEWRGSGGDAPHNGITKACYEYAMREDILMVFESSEIDEKHARVLLEKGVTLADIYDDFIDLETDHMQDIRDTIGDRADKIIREAEKGGR